ncbi:hypothetical protein BVRB_8g180910 [Beta vulgaris subsp. vulgaris]|nr:hypothetical protein BVRB_8g180910 [Beta vulgaris subsp. vulgaris]
MFIRSSSSRSSLNILGSFRNIIHSTGFPATTSIERLDVLNDELHVMVFSLVGGDRSHRLANYQGTISLLRAGRRTIVTETYKVDVPKDSNEEDTRYVVDTMVAPSWVSRVSVSTLSASIPLVKKIIPINVPIPTAVITNFFTKSPTPTPPRGFCIIKPA